MAKKAMRGYRASKSPKAPTEFDRLIGGRIRVARSARGISQVKLAEELGVSLQQVRKYENGTNRTSSQRLYKLAQLLDIEVGFFFERIDDAVFERRRQALLLDRPAQEFARLVAKITDERVRAELLNLLQTLTSEEE
jgi:transcriptional regulator with XRE-family HTH domain